MAYDSEGFVSPTTLRPTTRTALLKARALIEEGWVQHKECSTVEGRKSYCIYGGIAKAAKDGILFTACERALLAHLPSGYPANYKGITAFNDNPYTTKADVLALFDKALADGV